MTTPNGRFRPDGFRAGLDEKQPFAEFGLPAAPGPGCVKTRHLLPGLASSFQPSIFAERSRAERLNGSIRAIGRTDARDVVALPPGRLRNRGESGSSDRFIRRTVRETWATSQLAKFGQSERTVRRPVSIGASSRAALATAPSGNLDGDSRMVSEVAEFSHSSRQLLHKPPNTVFFAKALKRRFWRCRKRCPGQFAAIERGATSTHHFCRLCRK
jgi:hypothetical protein